MGLPSGSSQAPLFGFLLSLLLSLLAGRRIEMSLSAAAEAAGPLPKNLTPEEPGASPPLRVCLLVEPSPLTYVSGYRNRFQSLLRHLADGHDTVELVTVEVVDGDPPRRWLGFPVHYTRGVPLPHYPLMSISTDYTLKAFRVIARMRPDILHVTSPGFMIFGALFCSRIFQIPVVVSYHTHLPVFVRSYLRPRIVSRMAERLIWFLIRIVHSLADLTVVTSPQILADFNRHRVPKCQVWQKGIDTERFHPRYRNCAMRHRMTDGHPDDFLVVYVGRLGIEKRLSDLRAVLDRMPTSTRLCFVGQGPQGEQLKREFAGTRTVFLGQKTGDELSQAFASADVFCLPSDSETLGFVVLESMASGVPVIGVRAGGLLDLIADGVDGYLIEAGDTDAFVEKLRQLKDDPELRRRLGKCAREETEKWSWQSSMSKLRDEQYEQAKTNFHQRFEQRIWRMLTRKKTKQS